MVLLVFQRAIGDRPRRAVCGLVATGLVVRSAFTEMSNRGWF